MPYVAATTDRPALHLGGTARATIMPGLQPKGKRHHAKRVEPRWVRLSRVIVENKYFVAFTTLLTVYALTGDDFRLILTSIGADPYFDVLVCVCIVVFTFEVVLSCLGKEDYFMGFFFTLDVISTMTLVLDLSLVANWMAGGSDEDDEMGNLRAGRTARVGAKAGRIVRVLRLVRILKLYKAYYDSQQRKKQQLERGAAEPGEDGFYDDDLDEDDLEEGEDAPHRSKDKETRVGKKLSEMTTRKVIILVLTMLLALPFLKTSDPSTETSAQFGAEHLWTLLKEYGADDDVYDDYAFELLDYVHYHNWYAKANMDKYCPSGSCANNLYANLFWVGTMGLESNEKNIAALASKARLKDGSVIAWESAHKTQGNMYNYGHLPAEVQKRLVSPWKPGCNTQSQVRYGISLIDTVISGVNSHTIACPEDLRRGERLVVKPRVLTLDQIEIGCLCFYFDLRPFVRLDALYNLGVTAFVCVVLCGASLKFAGDANRLVLTPVANMTKRVEAIRENPLVAIQMADEEFKIEVTAKAKLKRAQSRDLNKNSRLSFVFEKGLGKKVKDLVLCKAQTAQGPMETVILEKTIIKLGSLLALGFGEAGANIIGDNMRGTETAGVNAMIPGQRVQCILGLARIRNFAVSTEVLQKKIMTFVNQIAEIVHGVVDQHQGAPNKNHGESFVIIWQVDKDMVTGMREDLQGNPESKKLAGMSIMAFTKIMSSMHRSKVLASYRTHPGLQQRLGTKNCRVDMGFGLHCGWAIEGAVGSEFKIDASYLSPNVSIVNSLEGATITYGVSLIVAESVVDLCSSGMRSKCRLIDCVIVTGSQRSMRLFSVDLDPSHLTSSDSNHTFQWNPRNRFKARQFLESQKQVKMTEDVEVASLFNADKDIARMRRTYTSTFTNQFGMGFQNYIEGEWPVASRMLQETQGMLGWPDGPSSALLRYMQVFGYQAPKDWKGVRDLPKGRDDTFQTDHHMVSRHNERSSSKEIPQRSSLKLFDSKTDERSSFQIPSEERVRNSFKPTVPATHSLKTQI